MIAGCGTNINGVSVATLNCIFPLLGTIIFWALTFAGIIAVVLIIFAGIRLITSGGDPKTVDTARKTLSYAILGLVVIFLAFFIVQIIAYITGVACINPNNPLAGFTTCN